MKMKINDIIKWAGLYIFTGIGAMLFVGGIENLSVVQYLAKSFIFPYYIFVNAIYGELFRAVLMIVSGTVFASVYMFIHKRFISGDKK